MANKNVRIQAGPGYLSFKDDARSEKDFQDLVKNRGSSDTFTVTVSSTHYPTGFPRTGGNIPDAKKVFVNPTNAQAVISYAKSLATSFSQVLDKIWNESAEKIRMLKSQLNTLEKSRIEDVKKAAQSFKL